MQESSARDRSRSFSLDNPFPGLRAFEPDEDHLYFGRERQIDDLLIRLGETRFLSVVGTSGCGKSSLVRAGLVPSLHSGYMPDAGSSWRVAIMRPGDKPISNLAAALDDPEVLGMTEQFGDAGRMMLETALRSSSRGLAESVRQGKIGESDSVLVVVDQFEELFRLRRKSGSERDESIAFVKLLLTAPREVERLYVVLTMRSDFIGDCMEFPDLPEAINEGQYLVPRMTRDEVRLAITGPVGVRGAEISPRLVSRLLNDIVDDQDQLPVLQHSLMRMWGHWEYATGEGPIDLDHYEAIGTMREALSKHAEKTFQGLPSKRHREVAEKLFKALTDTDRDGRGIRRLARIQDVADVADTEPGVVIEVVEAFRFLGRSFLMPPPPRGHASGVELDADSTVDLSHESLMRKWTRLIGWATDEAEAAKIYRRLAEAAVLHEKGEVGVWRRPELDNGLAWKEEHKPTRQWAERYHPEFDRAMAFLAESNRRRYAWRVLFAVLFLAGVAGTLIVYGDRTRRAEAELRSAILAAREPLVQALLLAEMGEDLGSALSLYGPVAAAPIPLAVLESDSHSDELKAGGFGLAGSDYEGRVVTVSASGLVRWWSADGKGDPTAFQIGEGGEDAPRVTAAALSRDLGWLAVGYDDGSGWIGRSDGTGDAVPVPAYSDGYVSALAFGPEGRMIAAADADHGVRIWSRQGSEMLAFGEPGQLAHYGEITAIDFDPSGRRLLTASWDFTIKIWELANPVEPVVTLEVDEAVQSAAFGPDGSWIAYGDFLGAVRIWSVGSLATTELGSHGREVLDVVVSTDGSKLVTSSRDRTAMVWSLRSVALEQGVDETTAVAVDGPPTRLSGHTGAVLAVSVDAEADRVITLSEDGTARVWWAESREPQVIGRHSERVESVGFSPDGSRVVTASDDQTAVIWTLDGSADPVRLDQHDDWVRAAAFSPDGKKVVTASEDGTWILHDLATGEGRLSPSLGRLYTAAFSGDGSKVVVGGFDGTARVWDPDGDMRKPARELEGHQDWIWSAGFSPDGSRIVTASRDMTARIWSLLTDHPPTELIGHEESVLSASFSPDGSKIVTASADETARVWDLLGEQSLVIRHDASVNSAAFSADGKWIVTACEDGTARMWSAADGREHLVMRHGAEVRSAVFAPHDAGVVTGSVDGRVRFWRVTWAALLEYARQASTACVSPEVRVRLLSESEKRARANYEACERRHGRSVG